VGGYRIPELPTEVSHEGTDADTSPRIAMARPGSVDATHEAQHPPAGDGPWSGAIPATGLASVVRIPIPGTSGLCIELAPRGRIPGSGSTSTLFFQDVTGRRHLRLDYGWNVKTRSVNYHWNQSGTHANFGIADHTTVGEVGATAYRAARYFRYAGRVLLVAGVAIDAVSIVESDRPLRRATQVVASWAGAWLGCKVVGAGGAELGALASPLGIAAGGFAGCIVGGAVGYWGAGIAAADVYDWAEGTRFTVLPEAPAP